ncbi:MAG TPA: universal stress protein, partial [Paracoccus sp.]|nr:universal stress protein [Paracoccus sp. (in: a-proteobacteria)]
MYEHILIATDGSELADKGLEHGLKLAAAVGARATVLMVSQPLSAQASLAAQSSGIKDPAARYDQQI